LIDIFGGTATLHQANGTAHIQAGSLISVKGQKGQITRKDEVKAFLLKEGPFSHKDIQRLTSIPKSSVTVALRDDKTFYAKDGKWYVLGQAS
jgi:hypothetical protein